MLITGFVIVILSFLVLSFGETVTAKCLVSLRDGVPGKSDAVCPSSPIPSSMRSNFGNVVFAVLKKEIKSSSYFSADSG
jgi:hypothetical protein